MIKRILVPLDLSPQSMLALDEAVALARPLKATLHICFVVETVYFAAPGSGTAIDDFVAAQEASAATRLAEIERNYARRGVRLRGAVLCGSPAEAIGSHARRVQADLIVVATHGRTGLSRVLLGSVAQRLVRTAPCSVLIVRAGAAGGRRTRRKARRG
jgi:nucleotide-binding universal stress UspA family protein